MPKKEQEIKQQIEEGFKQIPAALAKAIKDGDVKFNDALCGRRVFVIWGMVVDMGIALSNEKVFLAGQNMLRMDDPSAFKIVDFSQKLKSGDCKLDIGQQAEVQASGKHAKHFQKMKKNGFNSLSPVVSTPKELIDLCIQIYPTAFGLRLIGTGVPPIRGNNLPPAAMIVDFTALGKLVGDILEKHGLVPLQQNNLPQLELTWIEAPQPGQSGITIGPDGKLQAYGNVKLNFNPASRL